MLTCLFTYVYSNIVRREALQDDFVQCEKKLLLVSDSEGGGGKRNAGTVDAPAKKQPR